MANKLLIHTCCAPCLSGVLFQLPSDFTLTSYFYNPNITDLSEYKKRRNELIHFSTISKRSNSPVRSFSVAIDQSPHNKELQAWTSTVAPFRGLGEKSARCHLCYRLRLEKSFAYAQRHGYSAVTTTLTISPHKLADKIFEIGRELESLYKIAFLGIDFKKNGGFQRSSEISKELQFYRQNYCGCAYSQKERNRKSKWNIRRKYNATHALLPTV